jgi:hypothetical protein
MKNPSPNEPNINPQNSIDSFIDISCDVRLLASVPAIGLA